MSNTERLLIEAFCIITGALAIALAITSLDDEKYFLFGLLIMIAFGMAVGLGTVLVLHAIGYY